MKQVAVFFILITSLVVTVNAQSFPDPATLSTGQGAPGALDPLWIVSPWYTSNPPNPMGLSYSPALINNSCAPGFWVDPASLPPPVNNGNWITGSDASCATSTNDGYRYFRLTINLPAECNGNSVTVAGNYILNLSGYSDNTISDVFINGNSTGISGGAFAAGSELNMTLVGPWVAGTNYIDVLVYNFPNGGQANPYGLLMVANTTTDADGDGVPDVDDQCPCTPGTLANGCPDGIIGDTIICNGESTTLTIAGVGTYLWNTGETTASISVAPSISATYSVVVTTSGGFKDTSTVYVHVNPLPLVSITGDSVFCEGLATTLTASGGGTYLWNTNETSSAIAVAPSMNTSYKVVVTTSFGCKDSITKVITVYPKPEADFTHVNKCNGTSVPFTNASTIASPEVINSWNWTFGDNSSGSGANVTHLYATPGTYTVTLVVNTTNFCSDTVSYSAIVYNNPVASFTTADVCKGADSVIFTNTSTIASPDSIITYLWNFGDGTNASSVDTTHKYTTHGAYNVILITTTSNNCTDAATTTVSVFDAPATNFTLADVCLFDTAVFNNTSVNPTMGTIASWTWNLGDGSPLINNVSMPLYRYNAIGNYEVTLITRSSNLACADTLTDSISVFPMPVADFTSVDVCLNDAMSFSNLSDVVSGTIDAWSWDFGDSSPLNTNQHPNHTYASYNTFTVTQIVTSNHACKDTVSKTVIVHPLPTALFSLSNVCDGTAMPFTDMSTIPTGIIQTWQWDFGDTTPFNTNQNCTHLYTTHGPYPIELLVVSQFGCKDSLTLPGIVNPNPSVDFTSIDTAGCEDLCIDFENLSIIAAGNNSTYAWEFGPPNATVNEENSSYCYTNDSVYAPVNYDVTLTVTSNAGCVTTLTKYNYITVYPLPVASFSTEPTTASIINPLIEFTDASTGANSWSWTFGENDMASTLSNPLPYTYSDTGTYVITLITSTQFNCADTAYQTVFIEPDFLFYIPNAFSPNDDGVNDTFTGKGIFVQQFDMMIFDRWGNLVFSTDDLEKPWNGKVKNGSELAQYDVYVYTIKVTDYLNKEHDYKGTVTLVR
jgi:gliding motility-associated-like protein